MRAMAFAPQGQGKTLFLAYKAVSFAKCTDTNVFANITLKGIDYTRIYDMYFDIDPRDSNLVLLDDLAASSIGGGKSQFTLQKVISQSRKLMGYERSSMYMNGQFSEQFNEKLLTLVEYYIDIQTIFSRIDKMPLVTIADFCPRIGNTPLHEIKPILREICYVAPITKYFTTTEKITGIDSTVWRKFVKDHPDLVGDDSKEGKKKIFMICQHEYHQNIRESERMRDLISDDYIFTLIEKEGLD